MRTKDEMIEGLSIMFDANDPEQEKAYATEYYEEIAARAVHDHMLALLGPRPKACWKCYHRNNRKTPVCLISGACTESFDELYAQCPKVEEDI